MQKQRAACRPFFWAVLFLFLVLHLITSFDVLLRLAMIRHKPGNQTEDFSFHFTSEFDLNLNRVGCSETNYVAPEPVNDTLIRYEDWLLVNEEQICEEREDIELLVVVHTHVQHFEQRQLIRETWANKNFYNETKLMVVFFTGINHSMLDQRELQYESAFYHDIVQLSFTDSYRNLTHKAISWLRWTQRYCSKVPFVLKIDDDVLVDAFKLMALLRNMIRHGVARRNTIICNKWDSGLMPVVRERKSKWFVSNEEFPKSHYGAYCSGMAYLLSSDLISKLYNASFKVPFFWIDDVYITGMLAQAVDAEYIKINRYYDFLGHLDLRRKIQIMLRYKLMFMHIAGSLDDDVREMWSNILDMRKVIAEN